jgi:hypothetical protein
VSAGRRLRWGQWVLLLELVTVTAIALGLLYLERPSPHAEADTIRDYIVARESVEQGTAIDHGPKSTMRALYHFPIWTRTLAASWSLGLSPQTVHVLILLSHALAIALLYAMARRIAGPSVAWIAAALTVASVGPTAGEQMLLNPAAAPLPFVVFVVLSVESFRRRSSRARAVVLAGAAGLGLGLAIGYHVMFFCQLPFLMIAIAGVRSNPLPRVLFALAATIGVLSLDSWTVVLFNLSSVPAALAVLAAVVFAALAVVTLRWRLASDRNERAQRRFLWLLASGNVALTTLVVATGYAMNEGVAAHYLFLAVPPLALLVSTEAGRLLQGPGAWRLGAVALMGVAVAGLGYRCADVRRFAYSRSPWTLDDALRIARHVEARGWGYRHIHDRLQAPYRSRLVETLATFMGRTRGAPPRDDHDVVVLPCPGPPGAWPPGWQGVALGGGRGALVFEIPSPITRAEGDFCRHAPLDSSGEPASRPDCETIELSWPFEELHQYRGDERGYGLARTGKLRPGAAAISYTFKVAARAAGDRRDEELIVFEDESDWGGRIDEPTRSIVVEQRPPAMNHGRNVDAPGFVLVDRRTGAAIRRALQTTAPGPN